MDRITILRASTNWSTRLKLLQFYPDTVPRAVVIEVERIQSFGLQKGTPTVAVLKRVRQPDASVVASN